MGLGFIGLWPRAVGYYGISGSERDADPCAYGTPNWTDGLALGFRV